MAFAMVCWKMLATSTLLCGAPQLYASAITEYVQLREAEADIPRRAASYPIVISDADPEWQAALASRVGLGR